MNLMNFKRKYMAEGFKKGWKQAKKIIQEGFLDEYKNFIYSTYELKEMAEILIKAYKSKKEPHVAWSHGKPICEISDKFIDSLRYFKVIGNEAPRFLIGTYGEIVHYDDDGSGFTEMSHIGTTQITNVFRNGDVILSRGDADGYKYIFCPSKPSPEFYKVLRKVLKLADYP